MGYDLSTMSIIPDDKIPQLPKDLSVISLYQSNKGTLWAGTAGAGYIICCLNQTGGKDLRRINFQTNSFSVLILLNRRYDLVGNYWWRFTLCYRT